MTNEYEYADLPYGFYDKHIPEIKRLLKGNDKIFITLDSEENFVSYRTLSFSDWQKERNSIYKNKVASKGNSKPSKHAKLSVQEKELIAEYYEKGYSFERIAQLANALFDKCRSYCYVFLRGRIVPKLDIEQEAMINSMLVQGNSLMVIAKGLGLSIDLVKKYMANNPIPIIPKQAKEPKKEIKQPTEIQPEKPAKLPLPKRINKKQPEVPTQAEKPYNPEIKAEIDRFGLNFEQRQKIQYLLSVGSLPHSIAKSVGIELETLKKYLQK